MPWRHLIGTSHAIAKSLQGVSEPQSNSGDDSLLKGTNYKFSTAIVKEVISNPTEYFNREYICRQKKVLNLKQKI